MNNIRKMYPGLWARANESANRYVEKQIDA
jgi:hypothetical protein